MMYNRDYKDPSHVLVDSKEHAITHSDQFHACKYMVHFTKKDKVDPPPSIWEVLHYAISLNVSPFEQKTYLNE